MPALPLLTSVIEQGLNHLLALDEDSAKRLQSLAGKQLIVQLKEWSQPFALAFSAQGVDVLALPLTPEAIIATLDKQQCFVQTQLSALPELKQSSQLTAMIRQGVLSVDGELNIAQQASELFAKLDIDWEEVLASRTSDVFAHQAFAIAKQVGEQAKTLFSRAGHIVRDTLVDEKPVVASKLGLLHFYDQVDELRNDVDRFEARLANLEAAVTMRSNED